MRQIREALHLHVQADLSYTEVGRALKISKSAVGKYVSLARVAGVDWAVAQTLSDEELEARLYRPALPRSSHQLVPDFAHFHQELKRAGHPDAAVGGVRPWQRAGLQVHQLLRQVPGVRTWPQALDAPDSCRGRQAVLLDTLNHQGALKLDFGRLVGQQRKHLQSKI